MQAKKSLGQNFLTSEAFAQTIAEVTPVAPHETVLEVGPGKGVLTEALLAVSKKVIAVEKDDRLIVPLRSRFKDELASTSLQLIARDILFTTPEALGLVKNQYVVIANIPYYITGKLLRHFLESSARPRALVLMVQKEVADRIVARDKKESLLSLSVKAYGTARYIQKVPARFFSPKPKVDSAIILIECTTPLLPPETMDAFFTLLKAGLAHKRKKLMGNLRDIYDITQITSAFHACNIPDNARAEDVSLDSWKCMMAVIEDKNLLKKP
jgi:16S rRNA (adenine1518-N6/adenine1519-N6)-dimethyltransferase